MVLMPNGDLVLSDFYFQKAQEIPKTAGYYAQTV